MYFECDGDPHDTPHGIASEPHPAITRPDLQPMLSTPVPFKREVGERGSGWRGDVSAG